MKQLLLLATLLVLTSIRTVSAYDFVQTTDHSNPGPKNISCPSENFDDFFREFLYREDIQRAFTQFPLRKQYVDMNAFPQPMKVELTLQRELVQFPIFPSTAERTELGINTIAKDLTTDSVIVDTFNPDIEYRVIYRFYKNGCWFLTAIDDKSLELRAKNYEGWLDALFPSIDDCTPIPLYYNKDTGRTNSGILEKRGYKPLKMDDEFVSYGIREKFFGFNATAISIPHGTISLHAVTVNASASELREAIDKRTGHRVRISDGSVSKPFYPDSAFAYLIPVDENKTEFVCFSFEE